MYDTIIIGAGMSGLAAGIRLAYFDQRVCILERHTTIGGLNSFYRLGGRNYDVGLHAVTNFTPKGTKTGPLARLLRQLRFTWDDFALVPQVGSRVAFPGVSLEFNNDFKLFESEVARHFPREMDNFRRLVGQIAGYDDLDLSSSQASARAVLGEILQDPLLIEMLLCPLFFYGSARERDLDWGQFCIMFRSIYCEGLARPWQGVRLILKRLVRKFKDLGGELRLRSGVSRIAVRDGSAQSVVLDDGTELEGRRILSSAGWLETMRLCDDVSRLDERTAGQLSFVEAISVLDVQPREIGSDRTVVFYNDSAMFHWEKPDGLVDVRSGVICSPNNFLYDEPLAEGVIRVTALANFDRWSELPEEEYRLAKLRWYDAVVASAVRFVPDFRRAVIDVDMFTPTTIRRFTGHMNGAVYGAPDKRYDGTTHLKNLFVCGTDQGFVGIIGSAISGISMANLHALKGDSTIATAVRTQRNAHSPTGHKRRPIEIVAGDSSLFPSCQDADHAMPKDFLQGVRDEYDVIVIGSGLAGLTSANTLAKAGRSVLLLEHHYQLGGMATWFKRRGGHIFDISLHGFPAGMIKSCRRYWTREIADSIVQLKHIRFDNPCFSLTTTFDRADFTRLLVESFRVPAEQVHAFFDAARAMNFYDDQSTTVGEFFQQCFPGREDVIRLLMEPITYANGSTLEDPAVSYGIVFSNFMSQGVFTFQGGTDRLIGLMRDELTKNGVDVRIRAEVERIHVKSAGVCGVTVNGRTIRAGAVVSNANLKATIFRLVGEEQFDRKFVEAALAVRLNNSSCQVYMALRPGEMIDENCGDLLFSSKVPLFRTELLLSRDVTSRTFSFYYPRTRPGSNRALIVSSTNANYRDWADLSEEDYQASKQDLIDTTLEAVTKYVPDLREKLDHIEASTPRTFERYTKHVEGASFGTKFEGLAVSRAIPEQVPGLFHAGSVGIIMSGWLGAMNYGVIVANDVDAHLMKAAAKPAATQAAAP